MSVDFITEGFPAAAGTSWTTLDLSAGTEGNTGLKGGGTSLGTTSTLQAAAQHGSTDTGADAYYNLQAITRPAGKSILLMRITVATLPTENAGANAGMGPYVAPAAGMTTTQGFYGGFCRTSTPLDRGMTCQRVETALGSGAPNVVGAPAVCLMSVNFDGTTGVEATSAIHGSTSGTRCTIESTDSAGTFSTVYAGIYLAQQGAAPGSVVTWDGVVVEYAWV